MVYNLCCSETPPLLVLALFPGILFLWIRLSPFLLVSCFSLWSIHLHWSFAVVNTFKGTQKAPGMTVARARLLVLMLGFPPTTLPCFLYRPHDSCQRSLSKMRPLDGQIRFNLNLRDLTQLTQLDQAENIAQRREQHVSHCLFCFSCNFCLC